jgi:taurine transport system permease protein
MVLDADRLRAGPDDSRRTPDEAFTAGAVTGTAAPRARRRPTADVWGRVGLRVLAVVVLVGVWQALSASTVWDPKLLPAPAGVWRAFLQTTSGDGYAGHTLFQHLAISLRRIAYGSGLAVVVGIPTGLLIGCVAPVRVVLEPFVTFIRTLPPLAYFSLLILWFGIDEAPKVTLLFVAAVAPIAATTAAAVNGVSQALVEAARTLGASRAGIVRDVVLPAALPEILTGIRVAVAVAYTSLVAAETVNGVPGIGGMIRDAQRYLRSDVVVLGILVLGISGLAIDAVLRLLERLLAPWRGVA